MMLQFTMNCILDLRKLTTENINIRQLCHCSSSTEIYTTKYKLLRFCYTLSKVLLTYPTYPDINVCPF